MEPIGDPDDTTGDFAEEHELTDVGDHNPEDESDGETESPARFTGGMEGEGAP